jgi:hypothetical protein
MTTIYLIMWRYADNSGSGPVRAFDDEDAAKDLLNLLGAQDSQRSYSLVLVDLVQ